MPTVEKVSGPRTNIRDIGHFSRGDRADISEADARYLCEERGDFAVVDETGSYPTESDDDSDGGVTPSEAEGGYLRDADPAVQIDEGACPWCPPDDRYEGDHVGRHASSAHPDEWDAYTDTED